MDPAGRRESMDAVTPLSRTRSVRPSSRGFALLPVIVVAAVLTGLAGPAQASTGATAPARQETIVASDAQRDAATMRASAIDPRRDVASLLQEYIDAYRTQLEGYRSDADRQLASVVVTTSRLRNAVAQGRSTRQVEASRRAALASWTRARDAADTSWNQARTIMEPKLSFLERLSALSDYNDLVGRFDALGEEIRTVGS